ncbi:MAG TPA: hypothetical protein VGL91_21225 [Acidobacteriota bacterium]|jgi:hypothetical protein
MKRILRDNCVASALTAAILIFCCAVLLLQAHDPRTTAKTFSHSLDIEGAGQFGLTYKAMHFNEPVYKRMQTEEALRDRINANVWNAIGKADVGFEIAAADQAIPKGKYGFGLNIEPNEGFTVVFKTSEKTIKVPLHVTKENPDVAYLTFAIFPTDKPDTFVLEGRCGKYRGTADLKVPYLAEHTHPAAGK